MSNAATLSDVGFVPPVFTREDDAWLCDLFNNSKLPPKKLCMWEWAERNVIIPRRSGTFSAGPYRTSVTPWVRGWFDMIQDPNIHTITLETAAQVGKTTTAIIALLYWMCEDPDPILYAMPDAGLASTLSSNRIIPIIEESPAVLSHFAGNRYELLANEYTTRETTVRFIGMQSAAGTSSFPHRYVIVDEPDKILRENIGREGDVMGLVFARSKQFWNRKRLIVCTPTTASGYVHRYYLLGDQRRYFVPCPFCKTMQTMEWGNVRFDSEKEHHEAAQTAHLLCQSCGQKITSRHKPWMTEHGEWRKTAVPQRVGYASANLSSLYSNSNECTFELLVEKFLMAKANPNDIREFINQDLAQIWEERSHASASRGDVWAIRDRLRFPRKTIPTDKPCVVVMTADVQDKHIVYEVWAVRMDEAWMIDNGFCVTLDDLADIAKEQYPTRSGAMLSVSVQAIDIGYRTAEVYNYCLNATMTVIPVKGDTGYSTAQSAPIRTQKIDHYPNSKPMPHGRTLTLRHLHPMYFRDLLTAAMIPPEVKEGESEEQAISRMPFRMYFHEDINGEFVDQITGEIMVEDSPDKRGDIRRYYKKIRTNDYFDCAHYMLAVKYMLHKRLIEMDSGTQKQKQKVILPPSKDSSDDDWDDKW